MLLYGEKLMVVWRQQAALHTAHPARERLDGNADIGLGRPDVDEFAFLKRRHPQILNLRPQNLSNGSEQPCLLNWLAAIFLPAVDTERHYR